MVLRYGHTRVAATGVLEAGLPGPLIASKEPTVVADTEHRVAEAHACQNGIGGNRRVAHAAGASRLFGPERLEVGHITLRAMTTGDLQDGNVRMQRVMRIASFAGSHARRRERGQTMHMMAFER